VTVIAREALSCFALARLFQELRAEDATVLIVEVVLAAALSALHRTVRLLQLPRATTSARRACLQGC